jgi:hypothetical protein
MTRRLAKPVWLPHRLHFLLLRAALADGDEATRAWSEWKQAVGGIQNVDAGSFRLLPLVYRNLLAADPTDPALPVLRGLHRQVWVSNQLLMRWASEVLAALHAAGVATLVLKGAALAPLHYPDLGARPMDDLDLLVSEGNAGKAMDVLERLGFRPERPTARDAIGIRHAETFEDSDNRVVDLHSSLFWGGAAPASMLWDAAVPLELGGVETAALGPADQLFHVCLHGTSWNRMPPVRWIADATVLIRSAGRELDWSRLVRMAAATRRTVPLRAALEVLRDRLDVAVPDAVLDRLARTPVSPLDRAAYGALARSPSLYRYLGTTWLAWRAHRDYTHASPPGAGRLGFPAYLQRVAVVDAPWKLPLELVHRIGAGQGARRRVA